jgi:3'-5' exoribonuclease
VGILVSEMREGQKIKGVYLVREKQLATTRKGSPFLTLKLGDRSGEVESKVWEEADQISQALSPGDFVEVSGQVSVYNGRLQLTLQSVHRIDETGIDPADFLPSSPRDPNEMMKEFMACIKKVKDLDLHRLLQTLFLDKQLQEQLRRAPAAKGMHHAYLGGLLEHTLSLFRLCESVAPLFPEIDRDLLRAGVLLHDLGKIEELSCSRGFDYTDRGRLMGHIVLELEWVSEALRSLPDFPEEKAILLKHLMASHHGEQEFGSPVKPMILEALILHKLDDLDAKAQAFRGLMEGSSSDRWSAYHPLLGRRVFRGFEKPETPARTEDAPQEREEDKDHPTLF